MTVELFGPARALAGRPTIEVTVAEPTALEAFARGLAAAVPAFVGHIVTAEGAFIPPNLVLLDGRRAAEGVRFGAADRPCVVVLPSGG